MSAVEVKRPAGQQTITRLFNDNPLLQPTDSFLYLTLGQALQCSCNFQIFGKKPKIIQTFSVLLLYVRNRVMAAF